MIGFEIACVVIIAATLVAMCRQADDSRALLVDYAALAVAGWIGEETCIRFYEFYAYADSWHLFIDRVPVLVPLIWPLVILSARDVVTTLGRSRDPLRVGALVGALVVFDAALVEVIAVAAGLWSWAEAGHLGVPLIGILGWGFFATAAVTLLRGQLAPRLVAIAVAPLVTHALIIASWWGLFRWTARGDLGSIGIGLVAAAAAVFVALALRARRGGRTLGLDIALPRVIATALFAYVLFQPDVLSRALGACAALAAVPYLVASLPKDVGRQAGVEPDVVSRQVEQEQSGSKVGNHDAVA